MRAMEPKPLLLKVTVLKVRRTVRNLHLQALANQLFN